jgi:hypothetical protein
MAIPTITLITPDSGRTIGGNIAIITGTNFRIAPEPPAGYVGGEAQQTVRVYVGANVATWAEAASATEVYFRVPEFTGVPSTLPATFDVIVQNLDDDGVLIPTETVTEEDAYTYALAELSAQTYLQRVVRYVIRTLRRHVTPVVNLTASRDFDDDPDTIARMVAQLPQIELAGPSLINPDRTRAKFPDPAEPGATNEYVARRRPHCADLEFDVRGWAKSPTHLHGMIVALMDTLRDLPWLRVPIDPSDESLGFHEYEWEIPWANFPEVDSMPNTSDIIGFRARLQVKGVLFDASAETVIERGWDITDNDGDPSLYTEAY